MTKTTLFKSNKTQAVRLPKSVAFPDSVKEVSITRHGNSLVITPACKSWDEFFDGLVPDNDFLMDREQPADQDRVIFDDD